MEYYWCRECDRKMRKQKGNICSNCGVFLMKIKEKSPDILFGNGGEIHDCSEEELKIWRKI